MYQKKIAYLNYIENGIRIKNVGHAKISLRDEKYVIEINIKGLYQTDSLAADVYAVGPDRMIASVNIQNGAGCCSGVYNTYDIADSGKDAWGMRGLIIRLSGTRKIEAEWELERPAAAEERSAEAYREQDSQTPGDPISVPSGTVSGKEAEDIGRGRNPKKLQAAETAHADGNVHADKNVHADGNVHADSNMHADKNVHADKNCCREEKSGSKEACGTGCRMSCRVIDWEKAVGKQIPEPAAAQRMKLPEAGQGGEEPDMQPPNYQPPNIRREDKDAVYDDKWTQLCHSYKQLHPFGGDVYISLAPKDFIVLRKEYQHLVNNSFLLHGFYNYRHIILGRMSAAGQEAYYLGVPGTYYEREKMVAVMFGFESFEVSNGDGKAENGDKPSDAGNACGIEPGTFGYYLRKVEI